MARIAGVDLPREKRVEIGLDLHLRYRQMQVPIVSLQKQELILIPAVRDLTDDEVKRISAVIDETQTVEGDLRREDRYEHQETSGDWMLSWYPSSEKAFRFVVRKLRPMQEQEKVLREQ